MTDQDQRRDRAQVSSDALERSGDPDRPPTPWMFPLTGVGAGIAIALVWILPGLWGHRTAIATTCWSGSDPGSWRR